MPNQLETPHPIAEYEAKLRRELNPANIVEDHFVHEIAANTILAGFLIRNIVADPEMEHPQTPRRIRLLHSYQRLTRHNYEELRRHQLARHLQQHDPALAAQPTHIVVATHTTRDGLRNKPRPAPEPRPAPAPIANTPYIKPPTPGRNSQCPCGSGRKYKHCCQGKTPLPQAA
ncbi:MAG: SEC-C domain-containing protein [Bryobacterales bacterium]|nr:SEC-C domain-containing protein [Bryobacterales bacterium]